MFHYCYTEQEILTEIKFLQWGKRAERPEPGLSQLHLHREAMRHIHPTPPDTPREHGELLTDSNYVTISPIGRKVQQTENYVKWLNKVYLVVLSKQTYIP